MAACKFNLIVRAFSSSAPQNQLIKPPVQVFGIGGRYACALYSAATKAKDLDNVEKELVGIQNAIKADKTFTNFVLNPTIKREVKADALAQIASKKSLSKSSTNLLKLLATNGRIKNLDQVVNAFKIIMAAHRGEVTCEVISAKPLDDAYKKELESTLKKFAKGNQTIHISSKVDPSILGGLIISIGDKYIDMSIANKIKKYTSIVEGGV